MADVKLVVIYPRPKDVEAFDKIYQTEHVPLAAARLGGKTKIVATKMPGSPQGFLLSTGLQRSTFRRCRLSKRARHRRAGRKHSLTR